eukprot:Awhi_evm1s3486
MCKLILLYQLQENAYLHKRAKPYYYVRPDVEHFIRTLLDVGFEVVVYSGVRQRNCEEVIRKIYNDKKVK